MKFYFGNHVFLVRGLESVVLAYRHIGPFDLVQDASLSPFRNEFSASRESIIDFKPVTKYATSPSPPNASGI